MGQRSDYGKMSDYPGNEVGRRRNEALDKEGNPVGIGPEDTIYRYLCPLRKIGSIIGIGGDIAKQLRSETNAKIRISETIPGCDERVITIYSTSDETNSYENEVVSPAQDALFKVHDRVVSEELSPVVGAYDEPLQVVVRLLVPSDQIGCVIGKGGQIIQNIRNDTHAQIRILGSEHLPPCALSSDELIQITGEPAVVKKALYQIAFRLHHNPSRLQHSLLSLPSIYRSGITFTKPNAGALLIGGPSLMGSYGNFPKEFALRLVCPTENLGAVIGKGGAFIKQIRNESGAFIVVDSSGADGDHCIVSISSKEMFEAPSRTIDAVMRLQPRCSERVEFESGEFAITTRLLVPSSRIGSIIGKGGAIIKEMRNASRANIRIFADENVPRVASEDDEMVQITGDMNAAKNALLQVMQRLRANLFETDGSSSISHLPAPYHPAASDEFDAPNYVNNYNRTDKPGYSTYSGRHNAKTSPQAKSNSDDEGSQVVSGSGYGEYALYPADHSTSGPSVSNQNTVPPGRSYGY